MGKANDNFSVFWLDYYISNTNGTQYSYSSSSCQFVNSTAHTALDAPDALESVRANKEFTLKKPYPIYVWVGQNSWDNGQLYIEHEGSF